MPETLTINLIRPLAGCRLVDADPAQPNGAGAGSRLNQAEMEELAALQAGQRQKLKAIAEQEQSLTQLCGTLDSIAGKLNGLYQETIVSNRSDVAKLAVEIARKILDWKTSTGDYDIQVVIEEALKQAPTRQDLVVHVNSEDLSQCQKLQQEHPDGPFAELHLVADSSIARSGCLIETPKGVVRSFVEEHLGRIAEALEKAQ
jgi:flagellar biosynthesis/type III secretory pathway protein FliH